MHCIRSAYATLLTLNPIRNRLFKLVQSIFLSPQCIGSRKIRSPYWKKVQDREFRFINQILLIKNEQYS
ncbi:hypothetical protein TcWFU_003233 [Taenia crassiceps]|uniref:Uncharacterized protein n=1 Tax=Taenia crassiceps TaxID=6207 RepID=A0ABR4QGV8_9CEST